MRRVAKEPRTGTASLYRYLASKDDLLDLILDAVAAEDGGPPAPTGDWRTDLRGLAHRSRATFHRHPWMTSLAAGRPSLGPNSLDAIEHALAALDPLGFDIEWMDAHAPYLDKVVKSGRHPLLARVIRDAELPHSADSAERGFELGLERLLDGWEANPRSGPDDPAASPGGSSGNSTPRHQVAWSKPRRGSDGCPCRGHLAVRAHAVPKQRGQPSFVGGREQVHPVRFAEDSWSTRMFA
ncbi:TetR/AcrR family transcriptional regulator C-terminal domain-containing protein [Streptomyces sp. NPDC002209]|uniref:TetR/AcrR family transcriptional regulator C-terminal domain-containing protein n=1 Tax=Streptomyces sp. NPDC002209 TaxID=3364638 RepID=UPI0036883487